MSGVNKVILVGNLGKDPEIRHLENGVTVANFSLATSENYRDKTTGEKKTITEWHNIVLWRGLADVAERYLHKGDQVYIEGRLRTRSWERDGVTRYTTEVVGDNMTMLGGRSGGEPQGQMPERSMSNEPAKAASSPTSDSIAPEFKSDAEDDLPF